MNQHKELFPNSTLSHYRIVSKIGAGGMGEVYLAHDSKLDRKVALKLIPADVATNRERSNLVTWTSMKRFPQCNRLESDDALGCCRMDGTPLLGYSANPDAGTMMLRSNAKILELRPKSK